MRDTHTGDDRRIPEDDGCVREVVEQPHSCAEQHGSRSTWISSSSPASRHCWIVWAPCTPRECAATYRSSVSGSAASRSQARADAIGRRIMTPGPRLSTKAAPRVSPRYRGAIASRASRTNVGSLSHVTRPATLTPRNGGTVSKIVNTARSSMARRRSFGSSAATTTSNAESVQRNQTGETSAEPSAHR